MKKLLLVFCLTFLGLNLSYGQAHPATPEKRKVVLTNSNDSFQTKSGNADLSVYFGYDNKIKELTLDGNIPEKFPTKEGHADKKSYLLAANNWLKSNQNFIKPEFKNTILKD